MILWLDLETRSKVNLPTVGLYPYADDCEIMLVSWAVDDGPVHVDEAPSNEFWRFFKVAEHIVAHNAEFDRTVLANYTTDIRFDKWYCTMAQARRHGLPGGLDVLCGILQVPTDKAKMKDSRELLLFFCKPNKEGVFNDPKTYFAKWRAFKQYGGLDVEAMREVHKRCPKWNDEYEQPIWLADQRINARGFAVDVDFAEKAVAALKTSTIETDAEVEEATDGALESARQRDAFLAHILEAYGVLLPDLKSATLERRLTDANLPDAVRELIAMRLSSSRTSTSKYATLLRCVSADGRMRGTLTYSGAMRTQRWAGNRFQPHNLMRPRVGKLRGTALAREIANGIAAVKAGVYDLTGTYPLPEVMASSTRGCVVPAPGKKLVVGDYANVEGRGLAWLAGEQWKLDAFKAYDDGTGPDLYKLAYARAFGVDPDDVDDGEERQLGKVMELMLGYQGGVGAFVTGCNTYKVDIAKIGAVWPLIPQDVREETAGMWEWAVIKKRTLGLSEDIFRTADGIKRLWRRRHPRIVKLWSDLEDAVRLVVVHGVGGVGLVSGNLMVIKEKAWLKIQLPSGRFLSYPGIRINDKGSISYLGQNQYTRQWGRVGTYGGKLAENCTQAVCRDLLAEGMVAAQDHVVLHVHDELVCERPESEGDDTGMLVLAMSEIEWAEGLPLVVNAHETYRYAKE